MVATCQSISYDLSPDATRRPADSQTNKNRVRVKNLDIVCNNQRTEVRPFFSLVIKAIIRKHANNLY